MSVERVDELFASAVLGGGVGSESWRDGVCVVRCEVSVSGGHRRVGVVLLPGRLTSTHTVVCEPRAVRATFYYMRGAGGPSFTFGVKVRKSPITSKCTAVVHAQYVFRSLPARQNAKSRTRKTHTAHRELIDTVHEELFTREILYYDRVSDGTL